MLPREANDVALPIGSFRPNVETITAMEESRRGDLKCFDSVEAVMADLNSQDGAAPANFRTPK